MPDFIVKVCGVTKLSDAQAAVDSGANAIGFNFYSQSPRYLNVQQAAAIISKLNGDFLRVGVFVNPSEQELLAVRNLIDVAQIHGFCSAPLTTWRAINAGTLPQPDASVNAWLLDSFTPAFGGSGKTFDWSLAAEFPYRAIIAGGLDGENVPEAIRIAQPWGVDACSRLELSPGVKDRRRLTAFVENARHAFEALRLRQSQPVSV